MQEEVPCNECAEGKWSSQLRLEISELSSCFGSAGLQAVLAFTLSRLNRAGILVKELS